jgi:hypothetical protein
MSRFSHLGLCLAFASLVLASPRAARADLRTIRAFDSIVWSSFGGHYLDFEDDETTYPDTSEGWLPSFALGISNLYQNDWYLSFDAAASWSTTDYNGHYFYDPTRPLEDRPTENLTTFDVKLGKGFAWGEDAMVMPYADLGFRFWNRDFWYQPTKYYETFQILAGVRVQYSPLDDVVLTGYGAAGTSFASQMTMNEVDYDLGDGPVIKVGGKIGYAASERVEVFAALDMERFDFGRSEPRLGYYEPGSTTTSTSLRAGIAYRLK